LKQLQTLKNKLLKTRIVQTKNSEIEEGEILVSIESFAFTSNNVTYGVAGDTIGYWQFFKATEDLNNEWGCIPVWGFANVTQSKNNFIKEGEKLFGYFPPADSLIINPIKITDQGFSDSKDHRKDLPAVYNNYVRVNGDTNYDPSMDNLRSLLFPLHITSFCICDALEEESYLDADQIIIVSASSKTAIGLAQGLKDSEQTPNIIGLTSSKNTDFVNELGCYDKVISYDQLSLVNSDLKSVMVDMAGSREILGTLHGSLGDNMLKCYTVGMTHWDNEVTAEDALGQAMLRERTEFFFAPAHIQKRFKDWGYEGYNQRTNQFMVKRSNQSKHWMNVIEIDGIENFIETYNQIVVGNINPSEGVIVLLEH
tara:strand:+ start:1040 stop:2143 length:1104 start_codon:yes stop_codon:yes gene_type:complete